MAVNIDTRHFPIVREARAIGDLAATSEGRMAKNDSIRTITTGLIALALIALVAALLLQHIDVPTVLWGFLGSVSTFYFVDPRTLVSSLVQAVKEGLTGPGGTSTTTIVTTPTAPPEVK